MTLPQTAVQEGLEDQKDEEIEEAAWMIYVNILTPWILMECREKGLLTAKKALNCLWVAVSITFDIFIDSTQFSRAEPTTIRAPVCWLLICNAKSSIYPNGLIKKNRLRQAY